MKEIWKSIEGMEGVYSMSSEGRIRSEERVIVHSNGTKQPIRERILKPQKNKYGYLSVCLYLPEKKKKTCLVHQLVCAAFHGPKPEGRDVNHIDGVKTNNRASNLEWVTRSENHLHAYRTGLMDKKGEKHPGAKLTEKQTMEIFKDTRPQKDIAKEFSVTQSTVSAIKRKKTWPDLPHEGEPGRGLKDHKGEKNPKAKLTEKQAMEIFNAKGSPKGIAWEFSVSRAMVYQIKSKKRWKHIHDEEPE